MLAAAAACVKKEMFILSLYEKLLYLEASPFLSH